MEKTCTIKKNSEYGRFVVAAKHIEPGEILFEEDPFAYGPKHDSSVVCLGCYCPLNGAAEPEERCKKCGWPLCEMCTDNEIHAKECEIFQQNVVVFQNSEKITERCTQLDCITPLRVLLKKEENPERWVSEVEMMEDHEKERRDSVTWKNDDNNIVKYLHGPCKLQSRFSADLIQKVLGILEVNAFEARNYDGYEIRCLYPKLAILAHSCTPNTSHSTFPGRGFHMVVRATTEVIEGDQLNSCYTHTLQGTMARQAHLQIANYFTCHCKRCQDPTEMGTHFSSFKCSKCDPGLIVTTNPLNPAADWKCSHCEFKTTGSAIQKAVAVMQNEVDRVAAMDFEAEKLQATEQLFKKYRSVVHPHHFIQTALRQSLIEMYGRVDGYCMEDLPDVLLERKIELILDVLKVLEIIEPGKTRSRAMMLYHLHIPHTYLLKSAFCNNTLTKDQLKERIVEIIKILNECIEILKWEDEKSTEGIVGQMAKNAVAQLDANLSTI